MQIHTKRKQTNARVQHRPAFMMCSPKFHYLLSLAMSLATWDLRAFLSLTRKKTQPGLGLTASFPAGHDSTPAGTKARDAVLSSRAARDSSKTVRLLRSMQFLLAIAHSLSQSLAKYTAPLSRTSKAVPAALWFLLCCTAMAHWRHSLHIIDLSSLSQQKFQLLSRKSKMDSPRPLMYKRLESFSSKEKVERICFLRNLACECKQLTWKLEKTFSKDILASISLTFSSSQFSSERAQRACTEGEEPVR